MAVARRRAQRPRQRFPVCIRSRSARRRRREPDASRSAACRSGNRRSRSSPSRCCCAAGFLQAEPRRKACSTPVKRPRDPMTVMVGATTLVAWGFARPVLRRVRRRQPKSTAAVFDLSDAPHCRRCILIAFAIAISHRGSGLRCSCRRPQVHAAGDRATVQRSTSRMSRNRGVRPLRPCAADRCDPVLFLIMAAVFSTLVWREYRRRKPMCAAVLRSRAASRSRCPVMCCCGHPRIPRSRRARRDVASLGLWIALAGLIIAASNSGWGTDGLLTPPVHRAQDRGPARYSS